MKNNIRWRPSSWMQFSILRLKSSIARANSCWSIVSTSCRMASFNSFKLRGLRVYKRPFRYPQGKKSHDKSGDLGDHCTWPPRSPDLSSCDFFLRGYIKGRVYIMSFRWRPSTWMQFSILRLKSSIARANRCWSIVSTSCRMAFFSWFKLRSLWVYTRPFTYPQKKKSHDGKHVLWAPHFAFRRCGVVPNVSWLVIMWFLPLGVPEGSCVHSQTP